MFSNFSIVAIKGDIAYFLQGDIMSDLQSLGMHRIYDIEYIDLENIVLKNLFNELEAK